MSAKESCASSGGIKVDDDMKAAALRDEILFKQPESSHLGDCPICCLPLSLDENQSSTNSCCDKRICNGCLYANQKREREQRLQQKCPFCRQTLPRSPAEAEMNYNQTLMRRLKANDPGAFAYMGDVTQQKGEYNYAFMYWTKAAELGNINSQYNLSGLYFLGQGVEKDEKKALYHLEEAAIGGHVEARHNLGRFEGENNGNMDRAFKHFTIAANMGHDKSLELLKKNYANGFVTKDDFALALRAHRAAVVATISPQRKEAEAVRQMAEAASAAWQKK